MNRSADAGTRSDVQAEPATGRPIAREAAKTKVIASGNAQAVFRRLREIEEGRAVNLNRWAWELLQNARDAAGTFGKVSVNVRFDGTTLSFRHDGPPFLDDEIAHLIFHRSTKHDGRPGIGRFGTGFISTHLLSRVVRISGPLHDGTVFDFNLDRTGETPDALAESMDRSWDAMNASVRLGNGSEADRHTTFAYSIEPDTTSVVVKGLAELRRVAPLVLAFNPQFSSLTIQSKGASVTYQTGPRPDAANGVYELPIIDNSEQVSKVIVAESGGVQAAITITTDGKDTSILPGPDMSRVYVAFPLMKTSRYPLRAAINSELFHPRTERDGIYLEDGNSSQSTENRPRFERGCSAFGPLMEYAAREGVPNLPGLLALTVPANLESVPDEWLKATIRTRVVNDLVDRPVFTTCNGALIAPGTAAIPFADPGKRQGLWKLCSKLKDLKESLPPEDSVDAWNEVVSSWSSFTDQPPDRSREVWTLEKLVLWTGEARTMQKLSERIDGNAWDWLSLLLNTLRDAGRLDLAGKHAILPDQNQQLKNGGALLLDGNIPDELKKLAEEAGLPGRAEVLATELSGSCYAPEMKTRSSDDLIRSIIDKVGGVDETLQSVAVRLFAFVANRRLKQWLDRVPILTAGDEPTTMHVALGKPLQLRLLMPVTLWGHAKEFGELFPTEFVLHDDYAAALRDEDWGWLAEQGVVISSPLVTDSTLVEDFVNSMGKESDQRDAARSKATVQRSYVVYLQGDPSVLERVRSSSRRGILLLRFFTEYVLPNDSRAFEELNVECEDGEQRMCYGAAWIAPLLSRSWVKGEKRATYLTAESLADLLRDQQAILKSLLEERHAPLLRSLNLSPADLAFRSVGKSEPDRMSLIRSLGIIADAVGHDPARIARFAATIQSDTRLLSYIEQRSAFIEQAERNQLFGFAVERAFKAAFGGESTVRITRTGLGHDFAVGPVAGEEHNAGQVEIATVDRQIFVELKATRRSDAVHMSVRQVQAAVENPDRFWLCVVPIEDGEPTDDRVRANARFVFNIGARLKVAWSRYETLRNATPSSTDFHDETALEVSGQEVWFRIGRKLWGDGATFDEALRRLKPTAGDNRPESGPASKKGKRRGRTPD
jgi:hypothetical protein